MPSATDGPLLGSGEEQLLAWRCNPKSGKEGILQPIIFKRLLTFFFRRMPRRSGQDSLLKSSKLDQRAVPSPPPSRGSPAVAARAEPDDGPADGPAEELGERNAMTKMLGANTAGWMDGCGRPMMDVGGL